MKSLLKTFAPSIIVAVVVATVWAIASLQPTRERPHKHTLDSSSGFTEAVALENGTTVVLHGNTRLAAYSSEGGEVWRTDFASKDGAIRFTVDDLAVDTTGDLLVLGATVEPMTTLYRIASDSGRIAAAAVFPGMALGTISVAPDGSRYVTGFASPPINRIIADPSLLPRVYKLTLIHELDSEFKIARSFGEVSIQPKSIIELTDFQSIQLGRKPVFAPSGKTYLLDPERMELEIVDMREGLMTGLKHRLSPGRAAHHARIKCLDFLEDDKLILSFIRLGPAMAMNRRNEPVGSPLAGWEIRMLDLESGAARTLDESVDSLSLSIAMVAPGTNDVRSFRAIGDGLHRSERRWKTDKLATRLRAARNDSK